MDYKVYGHLCHTRYRHEKKKKKVLSLVTCLNCTYILKYISNSSDNPMPILGILE